MKIIFVFLIIYLISILVLGEVYFSLSRKRGYPVRPEDFGAVKIEMEHESGKKIVSWLKSSNSTHLIMVVHGHFDNSGYMFARYIPIFLDLGLDVLSIDMRNHGLSDENKPITYGLNEADDITLAASWVKEQNKWDKVTIFGTSMGAVAALIAASNDPGFYDDLILDSPYVDIDETLKLSLKKHYIPSFLYYTPLKLYLNLRYRSFGFSLNDFPDLLNLISELSKTKPILIARGSLDDEVSEGDFQKIINIGNNIEYIVVEGAKHSRLHNSPDFISKINDWLL